MLYVADAQGMDRVDYWLSHDHLCVLFFCSVFSIICYVISTVLVTIDGQLG